MNTMHPMRLISGGLIWIVGAALLWWWAMFQHRETVAEHMIPELWRYATGPRRDVTLQFTEPTPVAAGDPIFVRQNDGQFEQVGEIRSPPRAVSHNGRRPQGATAVFYSSAPPFDSSAQLQSHHTPRSLDWVWQTLLPPEKREEITAEITAALEEHHEEILAQLRPVSERALRDALAVVEQDLPTAIRNQQPRLEGLGARYQQEILEQELVPLVREEIWPIVRRHVQPEMNVVGREIWYRASLWRFGWRFAYDRAPLPERNLTEREWQRFVEEEAMPVLEDHLDDWIVLQQQILVDVAQNPEVRSVMRRTVRQVLQDPELQEVAWDIIRETVVDNPRLHEVFDAHWNSAEAQQAFQLAGQRLSPTVERIGGILLGTPEEGISPEFARVLRSQILGKDQRWFVLIYDEPTSPVEGPLQLTVHPGGPSTENPFVRPRDW